MIRLGSPTMRRFSRSRLRLRSSLACSTVDVRANSPIRRNSSSSKKNSTHSRARHLLMQREFQRHGYKLAHINPLERHGFFADPTIIFNSLPSEMQPIVSAIVDQRQSQASQLPPDEFASAVVSSLFRKDEAIPHEDELHDLTDCIQTYCACGLGLDVDHCHTETEREFFVRQQRQQEPEDISKSFLRPYSELLRTRAFAKFMSERYSATKRFGLEGLDAAVPLLNEMLQHFARYEKVDDGLEFVSSSKRLVLGTQHRGRLDFLAQVLRIPIPNLVAKWDVTEGPTYDDICEGYHHDFLLGNNKDDMVHISMVPIPAHLESMDAAVSGKARAHAVALSSQRKLQRQKVSGVEGKIDDDNPWEDKMARRSILPITIHGDASVCGQGVVSETLQIGTCSHYDCGGTIRLILNNQVGFTAEMTQIRNQSKHGLTMVSDVAKSIGVPVLHVNANRMEDVIHAARMAVVYRQEFGKDIFVHLWGWREHGHNEMDDPTASNVALYQKIESQPSVVESFRRWILSRAQDPNAIETALQDAERQVEEEFSKVKAIPRRPSWKSSPDYSGDNEFKSRLTPDKMISHTSVDPTAFDTALSRLTTVPSGFHLHHQVRKVVESRKRIGLGATEGDENSKIDWATAELLALATLDGQGVKCRLSGEDVQRGTVFQRHAVWHDVQNGMEHHPLAPGIEVCNSPLSEFGVLSFEYGYSFARPMDTLVLWEAQFGDFVNGAQAFLDAVLSSSDEKWGMQSGLTLLLPHGFDGMGPEHSSARLERWLQMFSSHLNQSSVGDESAYDAIGDTRYASANMIVAYPSEPSNYFHLLRRQLTWPFRRPLAVLTPKRTLRLAEATSDKKEFLFEADNSNHPSSSFRPILDDRRTATGKMMSEDITSVLLCSGELYYDLVQLQRKDELQRNCAIIRIEELAPFPSTELSQVLSRYKNMSAIAWVQEEPRNQGALDFVLRQFQQQSELVQFSSNLTALSRPEAAAPAQGTPHGHHASQTQLLSDVLQWSMKV